MTSIILTSLLQWLGKAMAGVLALIAKGLDLNLTKIQEALPGLGPFKTAMIVLGIAVVIFSIISESIQLIATPLTGQQKTAFAHTIFRILLAGMLVLAVFPLFENFTTYFLVGPSSGNGYIIDPDVPHGYLEPGESPERGYGLISWLNQNLVFTEEDTSTSADLSDAIGKIAFDVFFDGSIITATSLIVLLVLLIQFVRLIFSLLTKYVKYVFAAYLSPLCVSFMASPATSNIAIMWLKFMFSQLLSYIITLWGAMLSIGSMATIYNRLVGTITYVQVEVPELDGIGWPTGNTVMETVQQHQGGGASLEEVIWQLVFVFFFIQVLLKLEDIMTKLGFNLAPNASSVGLGLSGLMMAGMSMARGIKALGGGSHGGGGSARGAGGGFGADKGPSSNTSNAGGSTVFTTEKNGHTGMLKNPNIEPGTAGDTAAGNMITSQGAPPGTVVSKEDFNNATDIVGRMGGAGNFEMTSDAVKVEGNTAYRFTGRERQHDGSWSEEREYIFAAESGRDAVEDASKFNTSTRSYDGSHFNISNNQETKDGVAVNLYKSKAASKGGGNNSADTGSGIILPAGYNRK